MLAAQKFRATSYFTAYLCARHALSLWQTKSIFLLPRLSSREHERLSENDSQNVIWREPQV